MSAASEITRRAKSNLAFALNILPRERRDDMVVFYAFCRTMDDIADDPGILADERHKLLDDWENGITHGFPTPDEFQREVISLRDRRALPNDLLVAVIDGCRMDLEPRRFATWEDLSAYIWKVACAVGLVSARIFGCTQPASEPYAVALGHALQLTNILRDVAEDLANDGRIYLPLEDLQAAGCTEDDLRNRKGGPHFQALMNREADRAEAYFREASAILPRADRKALLPAIVMGEIYQHLLRRMRAEGFRVFDKRYRVSKPRKLAILLKHLIAGRRRVE